MDSTDKHFGGKPTLNQATLSARQSPCAPSLIPEHVTKEYTYPSSQGNLHLSGGPCSTSTNSSRDGVRFYHISTTQSIALQQAVALACRGSLTIRLNPRKGRQLRLPKKDAKELKLYHFARVCTAKITESPPQKTNSSQK